MNQKDLIYLIGIVSLAAFAFYVIFGVLKVSGMGLSGLGNNVVKDMINNQEKNLEEKIEKANEIMDTSINTISKSDIAKNILNRNNVKGFSNYKESIEEMLDLHCEVEKNKLMIGLIEKSANGVDILNNGFTTDEKEAIDNIIRLNKFKKILKTT